MVNNFFLRHIRVFNKSRYSRNRQTARVIFYFALYINILVVYAMFSVFYGIVFKLSHLWWILFVFFSSFFLPSLMRISKKL